MRRKLLKIVLVLSVIVVLTVMLSVAASAHTIPEWALDYADFCLNLDLTEGTQETFVYNEQFRRYQVAIALAAAEGINNSDFEPTTFSDVMVGAFYAAEVEWAAWRGLITGYPDGTFRPENSITREEMCVILSRYITYCGKSLPTTGALPSFTDGSSISSWALDAVNGLYRAGIITGLEDGSFRPGAPVLLEEAVAFLTRVHGYVKNNSNSINVYVKDFFGNPMTNAFVYAYRPNDGSAEMNPNGPGIVNSQGIARVPCATSQYALHGINIVTNNNGSLCPSEKITPSVFYQFYVVQLPPEIRLYNSPITKSEIQWGHENCSTQCQSSFADICPTKHYKSDMNFGWRYYTNNNVQFHPAIDFYGNTGDRVRSCYYNSTVNFVGWIDNGGGLGICLYGQDTNDYATYLHLSESFVNAGAVLTPYSGDIGEVGNTGLGYDNPYTNSHLHFSIGTTTLIKPDANNPQQIDTFLDLFNILW